MKRYLIQLGTVTYAIKARDLLRKKGFNVKIERKSSENSMGCGYAVVLNGDITKAKDIIIKNGIRILDINED